MMSKKAKTLEKFLARFRVRKILSRRMRNPKRGGKHEKPQKSFVRKYGGESRRVDGCEIYTAASAESPKRHIFYFHGGAYTMEARKTHWHFVEQILSRVECRLTFVNYPLAPEHTCADALLTAKKAYALLCAPDEDGILMGDSSGGGLALALAQRIKVENMEPLPEKIVLLSPWLDVSMEEDPGEKLRKKDLILDRETLRSVGKRFAGTMDAKDCLCSPLYGQLEGLGKIALFTGTSDILHVQARALKEKLEELDSDLSYYQYENMQHAWMEFPIPEAARAVDEIIDFIKE